MVEGPRVGPSDEAIDVIERELLATPRFAERVGQVLRKSYDQIYDGRHTGRYRWDQLAKVEKTHFGSLVEINLQREFGLEAGVSLDFRIAGHDVDCKWSQSWGGWMFPPEAVGHVCLLMHADDAAATFSVGLIRCRPEHLRTGANRDAKVGLTTASRTLIRHVVQNEPFPPNVLLRLPQTDVDAILVGMAGRRRGQARLNELFRRADGVRITRGVVATVAQQDDYMKRVRANGGSRDQLRPEGILILGDYASHQSIARDLECDVPGPGETVSVRVAPASGPGPQRAYVDGAWWRRARPGDPVVSAPRLPSV